MLNYLKRTLFISVVCIGLCVENAKGMFGVHDTVFNLPVGTNGLQSLQQKRKICGTDKDCVYVIVNGDNIYFPADGTQPTTIESGICSCANVNSDSITDWYIRAFGGDDAVEWSKNTDPENADSAPKLGFEKLCTPTEETEEMTTVKLTVTTLKAQTTEKHIITVEGDATFKKAFWTTFRIIASDPVGRVLLYRLLIEIRRKCSKPVEGLGITYKDVIYINAGSVESTDAFIFLPSLGDRNNCRSVTIKQADSNSFSLSEQCINFSSSNDIKTSVLKIEGNNIKSEEVKRTADVGLFHEMLHWFHYLRDYDRYNKDCRFDGSYCHLMMCYFGNNKLQEVFNNYNELLVNSTAKHNNLPVIAGLT